MYIDEQDRLALIKVSNGCIELYDLSVNRRTRANMFLAYIMFICVFYKIKK